MSIFEKKKFTIKKLSNDYYKKIMFAKSFILTVLAASANAVSLETEETRCGYVAPCQLP